jgi:3-phenylpropionate/trans-cinnamate dioxygenase ferredoxin reductase component
MTADAAARGILSAQEGARVILLTEEPHPPYDRPPLSKGLWAGGDESRIWRDTAELGAEVVTGVRVVSLDPEAAVVRDDRGERHAYDSLLLATGARPRRLEGADEGVVYLRTLEDFRILRSRMDGGGEVAVAGAGFIGCEIAGSLAALDVPVHQYFPEQLPMEAVLPEAFSRLLQRHLEGMGVSLHPGIPVQGSSTSGSGIRLIHGDGTGTGDFAAVVAGLGVTPRDELAREAGLEVDDGIVVDEYLATSREGVYAAGDVARFPLPFPPDDRSRSDGSAGSSRLVRVEHEEHANESGLTAGRNMAGAGVRYEPLPYVYSGIGSLVVETLGLPRRGDRVDIQAPSDPDGRGLARFHREGRVSGVLIWNRPGRAHRIRRRLSDQESDPELDELEELLG